LRLEKVENAAAAETIEQERLKRVEEADPFFFPTIPLSLTTKQLTTHN
jgi:hypothetical protein